MEKQGNNTSGELTSVWTAAAPPLSARLHLIMVMSSRHGKKAIVPLTDKIDNLRSPFMCKHTHRRDTHTHGREAETAATILFLCCLSAVFNVSGLG